MRSLIALTIVRGVETTDTCSPTQRSRRCRENSEDRQDASARIMCWMIVIPNGGRYEAIRLWCLKFGPKYARTLKRRQGRLGDTWHLDELFVNIRGQQHYLWRAVDQDGDLIDILVQLRRDPRAAERFFRRLLKGQGGVPRRLVTDKLRSYAAAHRTIMPSVVHDTSQYANNRAEVSHEPTRQRERGMRRFEAIVAEVKKRIGEE